MKMLMVLAHCDDEVIFGWPILQNYRADEIEILICSNIADRAKYLYRLCENLKIKCSHIEQPSFYRQNTRNGQLQKTLGNIKTTIDSKKFDVIYTHNSWGEYGHIDHILLHQLIKLNYKKVLSSDVFIPNMWTPYNKIIKPFHYDQPIIKNKLEIYAEHWNYYPPKSWDQPPVKECMIYGN